MQPDALRRAASVWRTLGIIIGQSVAQSLAISPHYRHQPSVRLVIRQGIKEANAPFEGAKCVFEARLLHCLAVIHTKVARCAQLGFVEALCTSGDDQRPDKRPSEAIRGHQRPSEGSSKSSEGFVEEAHRQTCLFEWHSRAQEDASGVAGLLEVIVRVAVGTILEKRGYLARRDLRGTIEQLTFEGANKGRIRAIRGNQRAD